MRAHAPPQQCSCHTAQPLGWVGPLRTRRRRVVSNASSLLATVAPTSSKAPQQGAPALSSPQRELQRWSPAARSGPAQDEDPLHMYVALEQDVVSSNNSLGYEQALKVGLTALRLLGVHGISVDVLWGVVEQAPQRYDWSGYKLLFALIVEMGFKLKVNLCFHGSEAAPLPSWLLHLGQQDPNIWYADKAGQRSTECLSLGIDEVPCLHGRTAIAAYADLMASFRQEFSDLLVGNVITDIVLGMGPRGELRYPSHSPERGWEYPGVGEFQCYDRYMLSSLKACAQQVLQPPWGLGGPHDAPPYKALPHQSGFFSHNGNWCSPYGKFFLQWYSELLVQHAHRVMGAATAAFSGTPVLLSARIPGCYWWYNTAGHAAELTAGYHNTLQRDGYLPVFSALAQHGAAVHLGMAEARTAETVPSHCADPERLLVVQRTVAAALQVPVTLENSEPRFDDAGLTRITSVLFDPALHQGVEIPRATSLVFNRMSDVMFEPANWQRFKAFVRKVRQTADDTAAGVPGIASTVAAGQ